MMHRALEDSSSRDLEKQSIESDGGGTPWEQAAQWLSRTLATALLMVIPGLLGAFLDQKFGTAFLAPVGFGLGLTLGTVGLLVLVRQFSPPARGKPLPWDDESDSSDGEESEVEEIEAEKSDDSIEGNE